MLSAVLVFTVAVAWSRASIVSSWPLHAALTSKGDAVDVALFTTALAPSTVSPTL
jgi:hypothetical protein